MTITAVPVNRADAERIETKASTTVATVSAAPTSTITNANFRAGPAFGRTVIEALRVAGAATPRQLGKVTGISVLIIRSVLEALTFVESVDFDRETGEYSARRRAIADYAILQSV